jgi:hypothetical protein
VTEPLDDTAAPRRGFVIVTLVLVLLVAALVDRGARSSATSAEPAADMPTAPEPGSLSSTWYCAGGTAESGGDADAYVLIGNPGTHEIQATVTVVPNEGQRGTRQVTVGANAKEVVRLQDVAKASYAAALVDIDGGAGVVEQQVDGNLGISPSPCASAASDRWYFADGSTTRESTMVVSLFNPFPENAIADFSFATDQGRAVPRKLQGLVVPARSLVPVNVGDFVRRRETIATTITVRTGRVVASKLQLHEGGGRKGMALVLGAPSPDSLWQFPEGNVLDGVTEQVAIYNPGATEASVDVELALEKGAAEPFQLTVPPRERVTLNLSKESRVPKSDPHAITVIRRSGPDVIAEQTVDAVPPSTRAGFSDTLGSRRVAPRWFFVAGAATQSIDEWVTVHNPSRRAVRVSMAVLAGGQRLAIEGLQDVSVAAGRRQAFRIGDHLARDETPLVVDATGSIIVERSLYRPTGTGISFSMGIPTP